VLLEIGAAWGTSRRRRITPIMCHTPISLVPDMIKNKKVIGINEMKSYLSELYQRVEGRK
jgi:hypothetical protein